MDPNGLLVCNLNTRKTNGLGPAQTACHCNSEQTELLNTDKLPDSELLSDRTLTEQGFLYLDDHETMARTPVLVGWVYAFLLCDLKGWFSCPNWISTKLTRKIELWLGGHPLCEGFSTTIQKS